MTDVIAHKDLVGNTKVPLAPDVLIGAANQSLVLLGMSTSS
jgi:hypothetical protein